METEDWLFGSGYEHHGQQKVQQFTNSCNRWMTLPEERALSLSILDLERETDPVFVSMMLHKERFLPEAVYRMVMCMFEKGFDRKGICEYLFEQIPSYVSLQNLVTVLDKCGYTSLSAMLLLNSFKWNSPYTCVPKTVSSSHSAYSLYSNLKRLVNNAQLKRPGTFLRKLADVCYDKMIKETHTARKQRLADKCLAIVCAETDIMAITFDKSLCKHVLFTQMKRLCRETSNTLISDLSCYGRLANAYAIAGDYKMCEQMQEEAKCKAYIIGPCIEFVQLVYIVAYVTLWEFERCPTLELRSKLLMWCRVGLKCVEEDFVETKNKWKRLFMLRMILCLLGLGNRATIIENCPVENSCIAEAKLIFAEFDKNWDGIETRRMMIYYVAKARLCELENCRLDMLQYLKTAHRLAIKGQFEEIRFIRAYCKETLRNKGIPESCSIHCGQMCRNPKEPRITESHYHVDESATKETHVKRYQNKKIPNFPTKATSRETGTRPHPIGSSCPLPNMLQTNKDRIMRLQSNLQQKQELVHETKTEFCVPSLERSPPSGDSNPDTMEVQIPENTNENNTKTKLKHAFNISDEEIGCLRNNRTHVKTFLDCRNYQYGEKR